MSLSNTVAPAPPGYTVNLVNPESLGYQLVVAATITVIFTTFFMAMRLYTRAYLVRNLGWDDCWISMAWLLSIVLSVTDCIETKYGMGTHIWDITIEHFNTYLKLQLIIGSAYIFALAFAKISICCFYLRLSPNPKFRLLVFSVMGFVGATSLAAFLVLIFSCSPVAASWDLALAALPSTICVDRPADYLAQSSLNIVSDIFIFLLPIQMVWRLQLPFRQKLSVSALLALGLLVCIISMIRLKSVVVVLNSNDASWDTNELLIWSTIEVHMAIICACIATLKPFVKRFFPKLFGSVIDMTTPSVLGRSAKLGNTRTEPGESFPMGSFHGRDDLDQHTITTMSKVTREQRRHHGDAESQESIIGDMENDIDLKETAFATHRAQES